MGCKNRGFSEEENAVSASLMDALLFTTMCIIGLPVDVHIRDGSIYSGIFHTACVENEYAIVLKRARMIKKGECNANVSIGSLMDTLIITSEDLVQVVAKGVLLSADGVAGNVAGDDIGDAAGTVPSLGCSDRGERKTTKVSEANVGKEHTSQTRCSALTENGFSHGFTPKMMSHSSNVFKVEKRKSDSIGLTKKEEASSTPTNERQVGNGKARDEQDNYEEKSEFEREQAASGVYGSSSSLDACDTQLNVVENIHAKITLKMLPDIVTCDYPAPSTVKLDDSDAISSGVSATVTPVVDVASESCLSSSSSSTDMIPPKSTSSNKTAKEFKLNPGAKIFSPSFTHHRSATPPAVPTIATMTCVPDNCPVVPITTAQAEVEIGSFARSSLPVKFVPYGNLAAGNGAGNTQYSQAIVGQTGSRTQSVRYAGQYYPVQAGPAYVHPNSQNVMVGRLGQLVYVHPLSHDAVQGASALSQVSTRPMLTPHQVHFPKHQGSAAAQALQMCVTPPFIPTGQQQYTLPSHMPISQTAFPVIHPIPVPVPNSLFGSKFS